ncbi:A/G-specific adenine DNA glycosylase, putative [Entamoeba invadens IP1]|uniref:A/G-specific adenine DNA glycosylase, putative n=1 Tax=Entamoeba invadens IP1 TaxID=370355 RepID=UPI0002C3F2CC|nr:A/G-specific adenine DNA glycosylase, putative [Entamoeba invadens IP1]ELP93762.1 A/G-specific adenine DNA glycosylase, putative [Entamoeba invadens IP1]|eukprot:XP_004260533.1 A/G-specific adenine DNA glycosylase, putative [Entamoeba invadens IP1]
MICKEQSKKRLFEGFFNFTKTRKMSTARGTKTKVSSKRKNDLSKSLDLSQIDEGKLKLMQDKILNFYYSKGRQLPWRETTDKYHILVSEVMLQQTQVSRVLEKYKQWMLTYPTLQELSKAPLKDVLELWSGLGYNSRAKRLRDLAVEVVTKHKGVFPNTVQELLKLPGIGPYTANAVFIFSENRDIATVDANIRRILISEMGIPEDSGDKELFAYAQKCLPLGKSRDWHNALMDYGALVATGKKTGVTSKTKQSKFEGSRRFYRAELLRRVRANGGELDIGKCEEVVKGTKYTVDDVLSGLVQDGLLIYNGHVAVLSQ